MRTWIVLGAGYTGSRVAEALVHSGESVIVTRRNDDAARALGERLGTGYAAVDLDDDGSLADVLRAGSVVVDSVPPRATTRGEAKLVRACARARVARLVYLGSTGVYPPAGGEWVDEDVEPAPVSARGRARLAAEQEVLTSASRLGVSAVSLRIAGIYGPGRGVHVRLAAGTYRIVGAGDTAVSRIHVDDLVAVILAAGRAESLAWDVINVADDEPTSSRELAEAVAAMLGVPTPPTVGPHEVSASARAMLMADRRIDNTRLEALGVALRYPTWREGMRQVLRGDASNV